MLLFTAAPLIAGLCLLIAGVRGSIVGDHPRCRKCGFDLFGRPADSDRCPECGAELANPRAVRVGRRQPRRGLRAAGLLLTGASLAWGGKLGWDAAKQVDWIRHKPVRWLMADVDASDPARRDRALDELRRRMSANELSAPQAAAVVDHALDVQADAARPWTPRWWGLIQQAASQRTLTPAQAERFLRQGVVMELEIKPVLRRGQNATFTFCNSYDGNRFCDGAECVGHETAKVLRLDSAVLDRDFADEVSRQGDDSLHGRNLFSSFVLDEAALTKLPEGRHDMVVESDYDLTLKEPFELGPVHFTKSVARPVELKARGAVVDRFETDPSKRAAVMAAIREVVVDPIGPVGGGVMVEVRAGKPPVPMAVEAVLVRGGREQRVGVLTFGGITSEYWYAVESHEPLALPGRGPVDVELRPSQEAADPARSLETYWGEPVVLPGIPVGRPAEKAFVADESLRPGVEASIKLDGITWFDPPAHEVLVHLSTRGTGPPLLLSYDVVLRGRGQETSIEQVRIERREAHSSYGTRAKLPATGLKTVDVVLRPRPDRGSRPANSGLPWGGQIVYRDVPLPDPVKDAGPSSLYREPLSHE